ASFSAASRNLDNFRPRATLAARRLFAVSFQIRRPPMTVRQVGQPSSPLLMLTLCSRRQAAIPLPASQDQSDAWLPPSLRGKLERTGQWTSMRPNVALRKLLRQQWDG